MTSTLLILGAGAPHSGPTPPGLRETSPQRRVLDWILAAFDRRVSQTHFVGGFGIEEVRSRYPAIETSENTEWRETRSAWSFLRAPVQSDVPCVVSYSDIVYHGELIDRLLQSEAAITVVFDSAWTVRYEGRSAADLLRCEKVVTSGDVAMRLGSDLPADLATGEFIGLVQFNAEAHAAACRLADENPEFCRRSNLSGLIEALRLQGWPIAAIDVAGEWAELNQPQDIAHFILGTKAETLARLRGVVKHCRIEDQVAFSLQEWEANPQAILDSVQSRLGAGALVVRSSALSEDGFGSANAGAFDSVLNVDGTSRSDVHSAISRVASSYESAHGQHQVLIQPMVRDVVASGVAFTRTLTHGAPFRVINYDTSGSTESVTGGSSRQHKTWVVARGVDPASLALPQLVLDVLRALDEIESLLQYDSLDIEFAVRSDGQIVVFQVRPIAVKHSTSRPSDDAFARHLAEAQSHVERASRRAPQVVGSPAVFGVMPDWNPAEIIGTSPSRMAVSLYDYLIMDEVWATQRAEFGYRDVRPQPLMTVIGGHPYVDVRASFNSFVPAQITTGLAARLVDHYLETLVHHPEWHDKVEFEVVPTCFGFDFDRWQSRLESAGFSQAEVTDLRAALVNITRDAFGRPQAQLDLLDQLRSRFDAISAGDLPPLQRAYLLLEDCRRFGTLPFAHLARLAFVAVTLLRSAARAGILSSDDVGRYLRSIRTVSHSLSHDASLVKQNVLSWDAFVERYGHLRPGTYDICSLRYDEDADRYLRPIVRTAAGEPSQSVDSETSDIVRRLSDALAQESINISPDELDVFLRRSIEGRELSKFEFSRNLSAALSALVEFGDANGMDRVTLSGLSIDELMALRDGRAFSLDALASARASAERALEYQRLSQMCEAPPLLHGSQGIIAFELPYTQANFVGSARTVSECHFLSGHAEDLDLNLTGRIAVIEQADPGFDWLFGRGIAGLVTMYGGANSHMAIRAAEFGIPAAIGIGEAAFRRIQHARILDLNAGNRQLGVVQ